MAGVFLKKLPWMPLNLTDDKSTMVLVMAWCHQATSHYLSQCWPRPVSPCGVTRPQWVNFYIEAVVWALFMRRWCGRSFWRWFCVGMHETYSVSSNVCKHVLAQLYFLLNLALYIVFLFADLHRRFVFWPWYDESKCSSVLNRPCLSLSLIKIMRKVDTYTEFCLPHRTTYIHHMITGSQVFSGCIVRCRPTQPNIVKLSGR